ncbi:unnamed protein product [Acanthosepion pharaonis]|uniref:Uncharacterized protein n=1 Tax=Acanthosepion pharaonis TaxID=158019 RepID=A0A812B3Z7_ACAPH|nr:unnamed protein product [Sepia pharaonis]
MTLSFFFFLSFAKYMAFPLSFFPSFRLSFFYNRHFHSSKIYDSLFLSFFLSFFLLQNIWLSLFLSFLLSVFLSFTIDIFIHRKYMKIWLSLSFFFFFFFLFFFSFFKIYGFSFFSFFPSFFLLQSTFSFIYMTLSFFLFFSFFLFIWSFLSFFFFSFFFYNRHFHSLKIYGFPSFFLPSFPLSFFLSFRLDCVFIPFHYSPYLTETFFTFLQNSELLFFLCFFHPFFLSFFLLLDCLFLSFSRYHTELFPTFLQNLELLSFFLLSITHSIRPSITLLFYQVNSSDEESCFSFRFVCIHILIYPISNSVGINSSVDLHTYNAIFLFRLSIRAIYLSSESVGIQLRNVVSISKENAFSCSLVV